MPTQVIAVFLFPHSHCFAFVEFVSLHVTALILCVGACPHIRVLYVIMGGCRSTARAQPAEINTDRSFLSDACHVCGANLAVLSCTRCRFEHVVRCRQHLFTHAIQPMRATVLRLADLAQWNDACLHYRTLKECLDAWTMLSAADDRLFASLPAQQRRHVNCR